MFREFYEDRPEFNDSLVTIETSINLFANDIQVSIILNLVQQGKFDVYTCQRIIELKKNINPGVKKQMLDAIIAVKDKIAI